MRKHKGRPTSLFVTRIKTILKMHWKAKDMYGGMTRSFTRKM